MKQILTMAIIVGVIATVAGCGDRLLRKSEEAIRGELLKETPLGTQREAVRAILDKRGWRDADYNEDRGFMFQRAGRPPVEVGVSSIKGKLGIYSAFLTRTYVVAYWGFDKNGELMEIWVWKDADTL